MPKGDGQIKPCVESLKIYNEASGDWVKNEIFKPKIAKALNKPIDSDGPYLIKKSEIAKYFGLVEYSFPNKKGRITKRGVHFYNAYLNEDTQLMIDIIMESIKKDSFGKNNSASKTSKSYIDPPKLLLKAAYEIPNLDKDEIAYLLLSMHNKNATYKNTLNKILYNRKMKWISGIPSKLYNKYTDLKFRVFFQNIGILEDNTHFAEITDYVYEKYSEDIEIISVYNSDDATAEGMEKVEEEEIENEILKKVPVYELGKLIEKNNRKPYLSNAQKNNYRYQTDYRISKTALSKASFKCEIDNNHKTFKTKYKQDYAEAHHLIPMKEQKNYPEINIDRTENIICLCPTCHRAMHYAENSNRKEKLQKIYSERRKSLDKAGINLDYNLFLKMYGI